MKSITTFFLVFPLTASVHLPSNFRRCHRSQPDFKECVLRSAQLGVGEMNHPYKELNLANLDPFELTEFTVNGGDGPVSLKQKFTNCKLCGLSTIKFDFDKNEVRMSGVFPKVELLCDYEIIGRILLVSINGRGKSNVTLLALKVGDTVQFQEVTRKGKDYLKIQSSAITLDPELVIYDFFNTEDKARSDAINPILNNNWKDIFDEVKGDYEKMMDQIVLTILNTILLKVPVDEVF